MASGDLIELHRSAIYLNNAGAKFLEREEYAWALETIKAGLAIMECVVRAKPPCVDVVAMVKTTMARLAHAKTSRPSDEHAIQVEVISFDSELNGLFTFAFRKHGNYVSVFRIEEAESEDLEGFLQELVPAIMLTNYAVAHLCLAITTRAEGLLDMSLQLHYLALAVLGFRHSTPSNIEDSPVGHLVTVSSILLSICQVFRVAGHYVELSMTQQELAFVKEEIVLLPVHDFAAATA